jgi:hypothetical protein
MNFNIYKCQTYTRGHLQDTCMKYGLNCTGTKEELCIRLEDLLLSYTREERPSIEVLRNTEHPSLAHEKSCIVCQNTTVEYVCIPCGHKQVCLECLKILYSLHQDEDTSFNCPICRREIENIYRVFD